MKFNINEIKNTLISADSSIKEAIKNLNLSSLKIVLVVDKNNKLFGTIVDGDIRRGLLDGLGLDSKIKDIVQKSPKVVSLKVSKFEANEIMQVNYINHLPIVDKDQKPIGLHVLDYIRRPTKKDNKIVIMAGGLGKRLLPLTKNKPKPLINAFNKPMLEHVLLKIKQCGFKNFIFSINYLGHMIKDYFSKGEKLGVKIDYIEEKNFLGTAGSLCYLKHLNNQTILVTNCDVICDIDYGDIVDYHKSNKADATMAVYCHETQNPFGVVETNKNIFLSYHEKPIKSENINAGIYILETEVLKYLKDEKYKDMPEFFKDLSESKKKVIVYPIYENWNDLGRRNIDS